MLLGKALIPEDKGLGLEHGVDWGETPPEAFVEMASGAHKAVRSATS
jgi:hypothetical protein